MSPRISGRQIAAWLGLLDRAAIVLSAGLGCAVDFALHGGPPALSYALLCAAAAAITMIDLRHHLIPDLISLPLIALGLVHASVDSPLLPRLLAMALIWVVLVALRQGFLRLHGRAGLGGGDVKLMTAAAAWLPVEVLPFYILAAAITGMIEAMLRSQRRHAPIAFGAHLGPWLAILVLISTQN